MTKSHALFLEEASHIRKLASDRATMWSYGDFILPSGLTHAQEEMERDGIVEPDVRYVLKGCKITFAEFRLDGWRYTVQGRNIDGIAMTFIVLYSMEPKRLEIRTGWSNSRTK